MKTFRCIASILFTIFGIYCVMLEISSQDSTIMKVLSFSLPMLGIMAIIDNFKKLYN